MEGEERSLTAAGGASMCRGLSVHESARISWAISEGLANAR